MSDIQDIIGNGPKNLDDNFFDGSFVEMLSCQRKTNIKSYGILAFLS